MKVRWEIHQCSVCKRWTASGRMYRTVANGKHALSIFICDGCRIESRNERRVILALMEWELRQ
jgi:hypothetical protein